MNHAKPKKNKNISAVQIIRTVIQLAAFLHIPGLFITLFSAIGAIWTAIITGSFVLSEQLTNILQVIAITLVTVIWGRFFCGWLCSFGAMQDLLRFLGRRITRKRIVPEKADRVLKYLKYAVLLYVVAAAWSLSVGANLVWSPWTVFGVYASPWNGLPSQLIFLSLGGAMLLAILIGSLFIDRFFCRYFCPLGAIFSLLSRFRIFRIRKPSASCGSCKGCTKSCPMAIPLYRYDEVTSGECIDCLRCTAACHRDNVTINPLPAVSGTVAAMALAGVTFMGSLTPKDAGDTLQTTVSAYTSSLSTGKYKNGVYTGSAQGFRGEIAVSVTVESGSIADITVTSARDDSRFLEKAKNGVIPAIIEQQDTDVAAVSGATYSSRGIIEAVEDAIGSQRLTEEDSAAAPTPSPATIAPVTEEPETPSSDPETEEQPNEDPEDEDPYDEDPDDEDEQPGAQQGMYADGVYTGSGSGFRGTTSVSVTVENGVITDITILSYQDDDRFFNNARYSVIDAILSSQSVDVSTVSGATYSSNSIKEAVANALGLSFSNPNSSRRH